MTDATQWVDETGAAHPEHKGIDYFVHDRPVKIPPKIVGPITYDAERPSCDGTYSASGDCRRRYAFTVRAPKLDVGGPPLAGAFKQRVPPVTNFRRFYERGDFPIAVGPGTAPKIAWKVEIEKLDYHYYLPIFFEGLTELEWPFEFFSRNGVHDMLTHGGCKILPCVPQLIIPLKNGLCSRNTQIMATTLKVLQHLLVSGEMIGEALVPYYRQLLPIMAMFKNKNLNIGDAIEYSQSKRINVGDLVNETLEALERCGGDDAYINIKYMIPTYESCTLN